MKSNEIIKEAEYADIVLTLLSPPYRITSVTKIIFLAFCIYHESNFTYYRNRKKDFVSIFFKNITLKLSANFKDIEKILFVLDMLVKNQKIFIDHDEIIVITETQFNTENEFLKRCIKKVPNPILEINRLDPVAIIEEVIRYV